jgi:NADPH-dependent curcumin reductase CurA
MTRRTGREIRVLRYPTGTVSGDDFEVVEVPVPDPGPGQVLVRNTWTSVDPGLRLRLRTDAPAGYFVAFPLGRAMDGIMAMGEVVESRASSNLHLLPEMRRRVSGWLRSGELVHRETVFEGLASAPQALAEMIAGHTTGKPLVRTT